MNIVMDYNNIAEVEIKNLEDYKEVQGLRELILNEFLRVYNIFAEKSKVKVLNKDFYFLFANFTCSIMKQIT